MNETHTLETLNGINPNTARKLFARLAEEWDGISWGAFRTFSGRDLRCFDSDSRWIPGDLFRDYFAERGIAAGRAFVRLYSSKAHRPSENAYDDANGATRKGNGARSNGTRKVNTSTSAEIRAIESELALLDRLIQRREKLDALRNSA